jgi:hypothetical protein
MQFPKREKVHGVATELVDLKDECTVEWLASALCGLAFAASCVATSIPLFVSFEVGTIDTLRRLGFLATVWLCAFITALWVEAVVYLAPELVIAVKPRAGTNEDIPSKPFWTVVAGRCTVIRSDVIVAIGAFRSYPDADAHLSRRFGGRYRKANSSNRSYD